MPAYKNKKNGKWIAKFRYTNEKGERKQHKKEGFKTKREAESYERDFMNRCTTDVNITFKNLAEKYLADSTTRVKATTMEGKEHIIKTKLIPYFGGMQISKITALTVRNWQNQMLADPKQYKPTYLKSIHNQLSAIFNYARKYYGLQTNPAAECGAMGKKKAEAMQFWTKAEFDCFIKVFSDRHMSRIIFYLLFYSGMREGELLALTLNDFDFTENTISITKTYARIHGEDTIQPPKTKKSNRVITMPPEIMAMVQAYAKTLYGYRPHERLFETGKSFLSKEMTRGANASGVKRIRIHDIRHSHASLLIEQGCPVLLVSERLGHENIETTLGTYSHLYPNKQNEVAQTLSELFQEKKNEE